MNQLHVWKFAPAVAVTFAILYVACALAVILAPDGAIAFFNAWFHGMDLTRLVPPGGKPVSPSQFFFGLVSAAVVSFAGGAVLAGCYNMLVRTGRQ